MQLEDYFEFHTEPVEYIRLRGNRIDIDFVIEMYLEGKTAEEIAARYPTLEKVQVYAAITYYLQNKEAMDAYLARREEAAERVRQSLWNRLTPDEQARHSALRDRLRDLKARFTAPDGRLDLDALRAHLSAETATAEPARAGA